MDIAKRPSVGSFEQQQEFIVQEITKVNGEVTRKLYEKCKLLGKGGFAMCYLVRSLETNSTAAAKVVSKSILKNPRTRFKLENEIKIHKTLHHPNIVELFVSFEDEENVYILLEVCSNESLNELIAKRKRFSVPESQKYLGDIVRAVSYLHSRKILHRDLKLGNIFLSEGLDIKLGDFGLATKMEYESQSKRSICGTPNYIAPEIISGCGYSYEVDIWSIGVILYTLLIGTPPFETDNVNSTYDLIKKNEYSYPEGISIPEHAKVLIGGILQSDPAKRPSLENILQSSFLNAGKSKILKQLSNMSITRCSDSSPMPLSPMKRNRQTASNVQVTEFVEIEGGFAYAMSNGLVGVDQGSQAAMLDTFTGCYSFMRKNSEKDSFRKYDSQEDIPSEFTILKLLVKKFRSLVKHSQESDSFVYVKRFIKHRDFYTFRLSNQTVQLKFGDGCQAFILRHLEISFTIPSSKQPLVGTLEELLQLNNPQLQSKSKYIREILGVMAARKTK